MKMIFEMVSNNVIHDRLNKFIFNDTIELIEHDVVSDSDSDAINSDDEEQLFDSNIEP